VNGLERIRVLLADDHALFRDEHGLTFPLVIDPRGSVNPTYHLRGLPTSWLIDRRGILRAVWVGSLDIENVRRRIQKETMDN